MSFSGVFRRLVSILLDSQSRAWVSEEVKMLTPLLRQDWMTPSPLVLLICVNQLCVKEWQQLWNQCTSNKLYSVQRVGRNTSSSLSRYHSVLINRLTRLTNSYLLKGENQPVYQACHSLLTINLSNTSW